MTKGLISLPHALEEAEKLCDEIAIIDKGNFKSGAKEEVVNSLKREVSSSL